MKKGVKYYVAKGIIGMGKEGVEYGIRCDLIHHAFNSHQYQPGYHAKSQNGKYINKNIKCISGDARLRHELKDEYDNVVLWEVATGTRKNYHPPYEYKNKRYYIHKTFLIWLRKVYGRVE